MVEEHGYIGLHHVSRQHQPIKFKLEVIKYALNTGLGPNKIASHFLISPSTFQRWFSIYQKHGIVGLKALEKRQSIMINKKKKYKIKDNNKNKKIEELENELQLVKMERDILKKFNAVVRKVENKSSK
ncbi:helix-turn-helix domain-containing protein [Dellaglioa sp. BT-FLS60]